MSPAFRRESVRPFQAIEAVYCYFWSLGNARQFLASCVRSLHGRRTGFPALFAALHARAEPPWLAGAGLGALIVLGNLYLVRRTDAIAVRYWDEKWVPNLRQRMAFGAYLFVSIVLFIELARFNIWMAGLAYLVTGSFPVKKLTDTLA
jgi:hypothetical protein